VLSVLVLPFVAWLAAIVTILVLFRGSPTGRSTTPKMGLLICLAPNLLLCCGLLGLAGATATGLRLLHAVRRKLSTATISSLSSLSSWLVQWV
jgi:hypothetical protein